MNIYTESEYDIIHETDIDFVLRPVTKEIHLVQYDNTLPLIKVNLFNNGKRYSLPQNAEANIRFGYFKDVEVSKPVLGCNEDRNAIYFDMDNTMTNYNGKFIGVLELIFGNKRGCSSPMLIIIDKNPIKSQNL